VPKELKVPPALKERKEHRVQPDLKVLKVPDLQLLLLLLTIEYLLQTDLQMLL
jgi:hypothetical protein